MADFEDVELDAEGVTLRGRLYRAVGSVDQPPAVVMAHGLGGGVTHFITDFAEAFAEAGITTLAYDHRGWGASDAAPGSPRNESEPFQQIRDYMHAVTYLQNRGDVDPSRIGAWGTSFSGGHVFVLGAIDRRIKAVVGQVPFISGSRTFGDLTPAGARDATHALFEADRRARARGEEALYIPIVDKDPQAASALPTPDAFDYFFGPGGVAERDPAFANRITVQSMENCFSYEPGWYLSRMGGTPVLMIVGLRDRVTATQLALSAFEQATQPKRLVTIDCGHFDPYSGPASEAAKTAARDFFVEHLRV